MLSRRGHVRLECPITALLLSRQAFFHALKQACALRGDSDFYILVEDVAIHLRLLDGIFHALHFRRRAPWCTPIMKRFHVLRALKRDRGDRTALVWRQMHARFRPLRVREAFLRIACMSCWDFCARGRTRILMEQASGVHLSQMVFAAPPQRRVVTSLFFFTLLTVDGGSSNCIIMKDPVRRNKAVMTCVCHGPSRQFW